MLKRITWAIGLLVAIVFGALGVAASAHAQPGQFSGIASVYGGGDGFGPWKRTSNGEKFYFDRKVTDPVAPKDRSGARPRYYTCATRSLPFHSLLRVTNTRTGRSVIVRVTDRGPWVHGRVIDLAYAAGKAIGIDGIGHVRVEVLAKGRIR